MDRRRINRIIAEETAKQMGVKPSLVAKIIDIYCERVCKIVEKTNPKNLTVEQYRNLAKKGIFVPGLGKFLLNWKIIEAYQNKYNKKEQDVED